MKAGLLIVLLFGNSLLSFGQQKEAIQSMKDFHQFLVSQDFKLHRYLHENVSYGHSNGWIEGRRELLGNLSSGYTKYYSFKEDSLTFTIQDKVAQARFIATIDVEVNGKRATYALRVLEVWIKQKRKWYLFARQAIKA
jgi:hypothetical protein